MFTNTWKIIDAERYGEMLDILPPVCFTATGFMVGEPSTHRECSVSNDGPGMVRATFAPFLLIGGNCYEGVEPMTAAEFRHLDRSALKIVAEAITLGD